MKTSAKRFTAVLLTAIMLMSFAGCGNNNSKDENGDNFSVFEASEYNEDNLFKNGLTPFRLTSNDKMGYVDNTGKFIIEPKFKTAHDFAPNGLAAVEENGKWGYIDVSGNYVIKPTFGSAQPFDENNTAQVFLDGYWGVIDNKGNWIIPNEFTSVGNFNEDGIAVMCKEIANDNGEEIFLHGFIDRQGKEIVAPQFDEASDFVNGFSIVESGYRCGVVDSKGNLILETKFQDISDFGKNGLAYAELPDEAGTGYIDKSGKFVFTLDAKTTYSGYPFNDNGVAVIYVSGMGKLINEKGEFISQTSFNEITEFFGENGLTAVRTNDTNGYINAKGEFVITGDFTYNNFVNGYARIKKDKKWGYIDAEGKAIIEPQFYKATDFGADGFAIVAKETSQEYVYTYALINTSGEFIINFK